MNLHSVQGKQKCKLSIRLETLCYMVFPKAVKIKLNEALVMLTLLSDWLLCYMKT